MKTEILIVSFQRDLEFLRCALRSIQKFARGFSGVTVLVPHQEEAMFGFVTKMGFKLIGYQEWSKNGFMAHADQIIHADQWCPEADAILFMDSDCLFWEEAEPFDYIYARRRPILYRERYDTLTNKLRLNWQAAVISATGITPYWETMVRHPAIHIPEVFQKTRELIKQRTQMSATLYINGCVGTFPQSFAEFPTLGAVAIEHFADRYHFVDHDVRTPDGGYDYQHGRDKMIALWSHHGVEHYRRFIEEILK